MSEFPPTPSDPVMGTLRLVLWFIGWAFVLLALANIGEGISPGMASVCAFLAFILMVLVGIRSRMG